MITRRSLIGGILGSFAAPSIVRASSLMKCRIIAPSADLIISDWYGPETFPRTSIILPRAGATAMFLRADGTWEIPFPRGQLQPGNV